jgi:hypothetical protein
LSKISADNVLFTFGMFAILMLAYGQTIPGVDIQDNMNIIFGGWPAGIAGFVPLKNCAFLDANCVGNNVAAATVDVASAIFYPATVLVDLLYRVSAFGSLMTQVTFGATGGLSAIPFFNLFLLALFIVIAVELFRLFRGSPSGL